ncbi:MAG: putative hemagglutinin/hemolysin-related protein [Parcubacteria group bacterium Gr01-1014_31]|nr:MAG: putative hemagglutinin/hemolysin-related protein [Parcubacteria group bacterium Gr01-1014_31]
MADGNGGRGAVRRFRSAQSARRFGLAWLAGFFIATVALAQTGTMNSTAPVVAFVRPPSSPVAASTFLFASVSTPLSGLKQVEFSVHSATQTWKFPADYVPDLNLWKFYWELKDLPDDAYVVTAYAATTDDQYGKADLYLTVARGSGSESGGSGSTTDTSTSGTAEVPTASGGTTSSDTSSGGGGTAAPYVYISSPSSGTTVGSVLKLQAHASADIGAVTFSLDTTATAVSPDAIGSAVSLGNGLWEYAVAASSVPAGQYTVAVSGQAKETAVKGSNSITIIVPAPTTTLAPFGVAFRNPPVGPISSDKYLFVQSTASTVTLQRVNFRVEGVGINRGYDGAPVPDLGLFQLYWELKDFPDGSYRITADAQSADGRQAATELYLVVTRTGTTSAPPVLQFTWLEPKVSLLQGKVTVVVSTDPAVGVLQLRFLGPVNGSLQPALVSGRWVATWDTTNLPAGAYQLVAVVIQSGVATESKPWAVHVASAVEPTIAEDDSDLLVLTPKSQSVLQKEAIFSGTAAGATNVRLTLKNELRAYALPGALVRPDGGWELLWDTRKAVNGAYTLLAAAEFPDGAVVGPSIPVEVNNETITAAPAEAVNDNQPPSVWLGPDRTVTTPVVALHGAVKDDGKPVPPGRLTHRWSSPEGGVAFSPPDALDTKAQFSSSGKYTIRLEVSDGVRAGRDELVVIVALPQAEDKEQVAPPPLAQLVTPVIVLPQECRAVGITNADACKRWMFEHVREQNCPSGGAAKSACVDQQRRESLPAECIREGIADVAACQNYLDRRTLPEVCWKAGKGTRTECERWLREQLFEPACQQVGITETIACEQYLKERLSPTLACRLSAAATCGPVVDRQLPTIVAGEQRLEELNNAVGERLKTPITLDPEQQRVLPTAGARPTVEQVVPFALIAPLPVQFVPSQGAVVVRKDESITVAGPAVVVLDADGDGLPDDVEERLGSNPAAADTDGDGFSDREEVANGYSPTVAGSIPAAVAPVERALAAQRPLQQPLFITEASDRLAVDTVRTPPEVPGGGSALQFQGRGTPDEVVTLFIYSSLPLVVTTRVNADGNWTYSLRQSLLDGAHEVYVTVNDDTGSVVSRSAPLSFFIREARAVSPRDVFSPPPAPAAYRPAKLYLPIAGLVVFAGVFLFIALYGALRRHA